jgi:RNA polymerase sigma factor (TIGR02999 family)
VHDADQNSRPDIGPYPGPGHDAAHVTTNDLIMVVYDELYALAERAMRRERRNHTLQPSALVHECYLRLERDANHQWQSRAHFLAAAAEAIRRILIEHARKHLARKRGGGQHRVALDDALGLIAGADVDLLELNAALDRLAGIDQRLSQVVKLRFFGGLTVEEVAEVHGLSKRTIENDWATARAWLRRELARDEST